MRVVTVGATHPLAIHLALSEGAEDIDLFIDLAIGVIEMVIQQREGIVIVETFQGGMAGSHVPTM